MSLHSVIRELPGLPLDLEVNLHPRDTAARFVWGWPQAAWTSAVAASDVAGHPYQGRDGQLVNPKKPGRFEVALRRYCVEVLKKPLLIEVLKPLLKK